MSPLFKGVTQVARITAPISFKLFLPEIQNKTAMSAIVSPEASSLLKPDPPLDIQLSKDKTVEQTSLVDDSVGDKSGDLLNYEHEEEEEDDEDELEALRMAALQSRKPKKPEQPAYTLKQHPSRNNLTQIVLSGPERPSQQSHSINHAVPLPDTSRPPPGYTPVR